MDDCRTILYAISKMIKISIPFAHSPYTRDSISCWHIASLGKAPDIRLLEADASSHKLETTSLAIP